MSRASGVRAYGKIDADHQAQIQARKQSRRRLFIIIGCSLFLVAAIVAVTVGVVISKRQNSAENDDSAPSTSDLSSGSAAIQTACNATRYPDVCLDSLSNNTAALSANPLELVIISVQLAIEGVREAYNLSVSLLPKAESTATLERAAVEDCVELLDLSIDELSEAIDGLESLNLKSLSKALQNVEIVISAASSLQTGCADGLSNITGTVSAQLTEKQVYVNKLIINALSLVQALASLGSSLTSWKKSLPSVPPSLHFRRRLLSSNDEIPDWAASLERRLLDSTSNSSNASTIANMVVGPGEQYTTLKEALQNVPDSDSYPNGGRFVIYIKEGTYDEGPLNISKTLVNITLLGDGCGKTIITGDASVSGSNNVLNGLSVTTYRSATLGIVAKGFIAKDITFQNTAGPGGHQAVALRASADGFVFQSCCFEGYQDTLYAHSGRQFYRDCKISGTVDFLFGDSLAIFQNCELQARVPSVGQQNTYTAQGKKEPNTVTGFSFQNCSLTAASGLNSSVTKSYLGRPWKTYSTSVFLKSNIGGHVDGAGWLSWNQSRPFEDTCTYGEYANSGAGSDISHRVDWECVNSDMTASQAETFSVASLLPDTSFIPKDVTVDTSI